MHIQQLRPFVQKNWQQAGLQEETEIQQVAISALLGGEDVIGQSPTGTGKTLAYLLPMIEKLQENVLQAQAVVVAPTKELVMQIHQVAQAFTKDSPFTAATFIGGVNTKRQLEKLKKKPQILIGTPERLLELIKARKIKMHEVRMMVFDEFDQLVHHEQLDVVAELRKSALKSCQMAFFSATISKETEEAAQAFSNEAKVIRIEKQTTDAVEHLYVFTARRDKVENLRKIVQMPNMKALVFLNDPFRIDEISEKLAFHKIRVGVLHGQEKKQERERTMSAFRNNQLDVLLATDLAARGLDIDGLTHVINLDLPSAVEQYIHRAGRVGRMGKKGTIISLLTPYQEKNLWSYTRKMGYRAKRQEIIGGQFVEAK